MVIRNFPDSWRTILTFKLLAEGSWARASWLDDGGKGSTNSVAFPALNYILSQQETVVSSLPQLDSWDLLGSLQLRGDLRRALAV